MTYISAKNICYSVAFRLLSPYIYIYIYITINIIHSHCRRIGKRKVLLCLTVFYAKRAAVCVLYSAADESPFVEIYYLPISKYIFFSCVYLLISKIRLVPPVYIYIYILL